MKPFKLKQATMLAIVLNVASNIAFADLSTERAVVSNDGSQRVAAKAHFPVPVDGDLYVATEVNGELLFFADGGRQFILGVPAPFTENSEYVGDIPLFDLSGSGIAAGRYPLYQVVTFAGTDPLNFTNWIGGLSGLSVINFSIGLPKEITGDFDGSGFSDDDANKDGFHDDDANKDGFHDDDSNKDGFHDSDVNQNGLRDDDDSGSGNGGSNNSDTNSNVAKGRNTYATCASSACHGSNPAVNQNNVLEGRDFGEILEAIQKNKGGMGFLNGLISTDDAKNVSAYLNSL